MYRLLLIALSFLLICLPANAELHLHPIHPDETTDETYNQRFSFDNSAAILPLIDSALASFRELTEISKDTIPDKTIQGIGNTEWDIQNLGFYNWVSTIKGTLYKQEYTIKKLQHELALEKLKSGQSNKKEIEVAEKELQQAEKEFQDAWNSLTVGD